ncbi:MAG: hypothetical protein WAN48_03210 [Actinomycetes bacterium]
MSTSTRPVQPFSRISSRALTLFGVVAVVLAALGWGFRQVDARTGSDQPVVVTAVNGSSCTVHSQVEQGRTMIAPCPPGTGVGWTAVIPVGGLSHRPLQTGLDSALMWAVFVSGVAGLCSLGAARQRRQSQLRHERAALRAPAIPPALTARAGDDDRPVRDRWAPVAPLPQAVPTSIVPLAANGLLAVLGVLVVPGVLVVLSDLVGGMGWGRPVTVAVVSAVGIVLTALAVRMCVRTIRWSVDGLTVRGYLTTRRYSWPDIDHVTVEASERTTKGGHYWTLTPALALSSGERVLLGALAQSEGGYVGSRRTAGAQRFLRMLETLDAWLLAADVPVDLAYDALRPWKQGHVSVGQVVALSDSPPPALHEIDPSAAAHDGGSGIDGPGGEWSCPSSPPAEAARGAHAVVAPVEAAWSAQPTTTSHRGPGRAARVLVIVGGLLLAVPAVILALGAVLLPYGMASGSEATVVVTSRVGEDCRLVNAADATQEWTVRCLDDETLGEVVPVVISSVTREPESWADTVAGLVGLAVLCLPGLAVLGTGLLMLRRQRRRPAAETSSGSAPPSAAVEPLAESGARFPGESTHVGARPGLRGR